MTTHTTARITPQLDELAYQLAQHTTSEVRFDRISRTLYATDAGNYQIMPVGVVIPRTTADLVAAVELCISHNLPVLPRGGGSSLAGQSIGEAVIIDTSKYLRHITNVDPGARQVTVQPGVTFGALNRRLKQVGMQVGPDPASGDRACIGGCIGNNATGAHSILYGMFADHILALDTVLADGSQVTLGPQRGTGRAANLRDAVDQVINAHAPAIRADWPRHWRRSSGYNLNYMLPDLPGGHPGNPGGRVHQPNLAQLLAGAEGTLAVVTAATLNLVPRPPMTALGIIQFNDVVAAMEAANLILELEPSAVEFMDRLLVELTRQRPEYARMLTFVEGTPEGILVVEFYGHSPAELTARLDRLEQHLARHRVGFGFRRATTAAEQANVWGVRKVGLGIFMSMRGDYKPIPVLEDFSVPVDTLPQYMADILALANSYDTRLAIYGHASAGCLHIRPLINLKSEAGVTIMRELGQAGAEIVFKHGGVTSGEHSDGLQRSAFNRHLFGPELYQAMREIKAVFDPDNRLNPGKVVAEPDPTRNLRYGPGYQTITLQTFFNWDEDGGLDRAIEMCNGAGVCRKLDVGVMCPSYMATQDERDTTRARANIFRALLSGTLPLEALTDRDVYEVFELCIGCKACKSECPSAVDMARIKTEYKAQRFAQTGTPLRNRLIGNVPRLSKWVAALPGGPAMANLSLTLPPTRWIMNRLGFAPQRSFPHFAAQPFSRWFKQRPRIRAAGNKVLLFNDTWTEYNMPHLGRATVKVLEAAGYEVLLETRRECCGRPMLTCGIVEPVKAAARRNIDLLLPYLEEYPGLAIVGIEPSCILSFRDEYPALVDDARRKAAHRLGQACYTVDEFLYTLQNEGRFPQPVRPPDNPALLLHGHCHQKALSDINKSVAVLQAAGYRPELIQSGCCGMAGNFGYEAEHFAISHTIAADRLLPAIEARPGVPLAANGISCRDQIEQFSGRTPRHLIEYIADVL
jgi:FAD/FMN-containing dehydrogenase/Fe-S oxidoreductase